MSEVCPVCHTDIGPGEGEYHPVGYCHIECPTPRASHIDRTGVAVRDTKPNPVQRSECPSCGNPGGTWRNQLGGVDPMVTCSACGVEVTAAEWRIGTFAPVVEPEQPTCGVCLGEGKITGRGGDVTITVPCPKCYTHPELHTTTDPVTSPYADGTPESCAWEEGRGSAVTHPVRLTTTTPTRLSAEELRMALDLLPVKRHECWSHIKNGDLYYVIALAFVEATHEPVVVYQDVAKAGPTWTRPITEWEARFERVN